MSVDVPLTIPPAAGEPGESAAVLCPGCGYDLRGATADRCSECGLEIDRSAMRASDLPWAHRRRVGRVRAFWKTVWYVTAGSRRIRHELARPQAPKDARRFLACNAACLTIALLTGAALAAHEHGLAAVAVEPFVPGVPGKAPMPGYAQDLAVPWSAGITLVPLAPLYLAVLAVYLSGVGRSAVRLRGYPPEHRDRARALMTYAAAPLAWLLPAAACHALAAGVLLLARPRQDDLGPQAASLVLEVAAALLAAVAVLGTFHRSGEWLTRAHHAGAARYAAGVAELLGRSLLGLVVFLGVVPWCAGLGWIIWDSLR